MPTPTYDLIEEKVLGSAQASVTFSSIPGTYKDLVLEAIFGAASAAPAALIRLNSDAGTNYSITYLAGNGSAASSSRRSNDDFLYAAMPGSGTSTSVENLAVFQFQSYANTNVNKTILVRSGRASGEASAVVGLWRSTSAITSITFGLGAPFPNVNVLSGSTFRLWGVSG